MKIAATSSKNRFHRRIRQPPSMRNTAMLESMKIDQRKLSGNKSSEKATSPRQKPDTDTIKATGARVKAANGADGASDAESKASRRCFESQRRRSHKLNYISKTQSRC
ncbi:unnamed protein product [Cochlearia groenlandica]